MSGGQEKKLSGEQLCSKKEFETEKFLKIRNSVIRYFKGNYTVAAIFEQLLQWDRFHKGEEFHDTLNELSEKLLIPKGTLRRHLKRIIETGMFTSRVGYRDKKKTTTTTFYKAQWEVILEEIKVTKPPKEKKCVNSYSPVAYIERNSICESLGFSSYQDYLKSELWVDIRDQVFGILGNSCEFCGEKATQVHHSEYTESNLSGKSLDGLHPICKKCHVSAEFDRKGNKVGLEECNKTLGIGVESEVGCE